jgi:hypothetical protein
MNCRGSASLTGRRGGEHLVGAQPKLAAETTADVRALDADRIGFDAEIRGQRMAVPFDNLVSKSRPSSGHRPTSRRMWVHHRVAVRWSAIHLVQFHQRGGEGRVPSRLLAQRSIDLPTTVMEGGTQRLP